MFLANENFPVPGIILLRNHGYRVRSVMEEMNGASDFDVLDLATKEDLIILTFDSDYGELIFRYSTSNPPAVIYFREQKQTPQAGAETLIALLTEPDISFKNSFTVVDNETVRQRRY